MHKYSKLNFPFWSFWRIATTLLVFSLLSQSVAMAEKRLAVLEFQGVGVDTALLSVLADRSRAGVLSTTKGQEIDGEPLLVLTRENMMDHLAQMGKGADACVGECEVELGRNIGVDFIMSGELAQIGSLYVLTVKLHETAGGSLLASEGLETKTVEELLPGSQVLAGKVLRKGVWAGATGSSIETGLLKGSASDWSAAQQADAAVVKFGSEPTGASVYLDGDFLCSSTPCQKYIPLGPHEVRFNLQRYKETSKSFATEEGLVIFEELSPLFGTVRIESWPSGVEIEADGQGWGTTPFTKELDPGIYTLYVADPCFEPVGYRLHLKSGSTEAIMLDVQERKAALKVYAFSGEDAVSGEIIVDGRKVGMTAETIELPLCSQELEVLSEEGTWRGPLQLQERQVIELEAKLDEPPEPVHTGRAPQAAQKEPYSQSDVLLHLRAPGSPLPIIGVPVRIYYDGVRIHNASTKTGFDLKIPSDSGNHRLKIKVGIIGFPALWFFDFESDGTYILNARYSFLMGLYTGAYPPGTSPIKP
jgi:hypothetical protein